MGDYETSASAVDESRTADLSNKTTKRRSLIFQRRSTSRHAQDNIDGTRYDDQTVHDQLLHGGETSNVKDDFDLSSYIASLKNEREEWKKVLSERKSQRRRLTQEINIGDECEFDLSVLTDHERSFILSRPNYHQIRENINNLIPIAVKVATLNSHINHLNRSLIETMEEKNIELTKLVTELAKE